MKRAGGAIVIREAVWPADRSVVEILFREYVAGLGVDLAFQNFEAELDGLPGSYARPSGQILMAWSGDAAAGVGCFRPFGAGGCEMKRLFVRPHFRGFGLGRVLAERLIADARVAGYRFMLLDSLSSMHSAQALYVDLGFSPTEPYYSNPLPGTSYMRLEL